MPRSSRQKQKLLYIKELFESETDAQHGLSLGEIEQRLAGKGILSERKSLYDDISALREYGMDIRMRRGKRFDYYLASRTFESAEVKLLVDAVQVAKSLPEAKSRELIGKLKTLTGRHEAEKMQRQVYVIGQNKTQSEDIYDSIDAIHEAICEDTVLHFRYFEWTRDKRRHYRRGGAVYIVSPWALVWQGDRYYLIGYDHVKKERRNFRVDKMTEIVRTEQRQAAKEERAAFDPVHYAKRAFGMFDGEPQTVRMKIDESLLGVIRDRFGMDTMLSPHRDGLEFAAEVIVSPQFFSWIFGLGDKIEILTPLSVRDAFRIYLEKTMQKYCEKQ